MTQQPVEKVMDRDEVRDEIEFALEQAEMGLAYGPPTKVMAELCRTWLTVQNSPAVVVREGWHEYASISYDGFDREQVGQSVLLVAAQEPTA